jgi:hypothetical protein
MRFGRVWLPVLAMGLALGACASGPTGTVKLVETGIAPQTEADRIFGGQTVRALLEVTGPTKDAVVVCKFSGRHGVDGALGWIIYLRVPDLGNGESTRGTCEAFAAVGFGDQAPSQPIVSITTVDKLEAAPADWETEYIPPSPWP